MSGYGEIRGTVTMEGVAVPGRTVVAFSYDDPREVLGTTTSGSDGAYIFNLPDFDADAVVIVLDDCGEVFQTSHPYLVGDKVRPTAGNETGYVYRCIVEGLSGSAEPTWWVNVDSGHLTGPVGSATFEALETWRPAAHAPVRPLWVPTGSSIVHDALFDDVVVLIHFDPAGDSILADPYRDNVVWHFTGEDLFDSSPLAANSTANGNVVSSTARNKYGVRSMAFDGNGDFIGLGSTDTMSFGTGDFTVEAWVWHVPATGGAATNAKTIIAATSGSVSFRLHQSALAPEFSYVSGGTTTLVASSVVVPNTWVHVAWARQAGTLRVFVDGVKCGEWTVTYNFGLFTWNIGARSSDRYFNGSMEDLRITKGTARYTADFTPPLAALPTYKYTGDVAFENVIENGVGVERFIVPAVSATASKFGGASMALYRSGLDIVKPSTGSLFDFGTGDYTIEFWFRADNLTSVQVLLDYRFDSVTTGPTLRIDTAASNQLKMMIGGTDRATSASGIIAGTWNHGAVCRASGVTRLFLNGTQEGSDYTDSGSLNFNRFRIGANYMGAERFIGYLDDLRVTKAARYTSGFTPPVAAFPDIKESSI